MGQKQKTEERERKKERLNDGNNNGQATHGAHKHEWRTQAAWAKKFPDAHGDFTALCTFLFWGRTRSKGSYKGILYVYLVQFYSIESN